MPKQSSRHATPDGENDPSLATRRSAKIAHPLPSRESMSNITNSAASKRILPPHLQSASKPKRSPSETLKSGSLRHSITSNSSSASESPGKSSKPLRPQFASSNSAASSATPQPRRKRTDAEPASVTPRPKTFFERSSDLRRLQSVSDISGLTAASSCSDQASRSYEIEPLKAYLRIRPPPEDGQKELTRPYIEVVNNTQVLMHPPSQSAYTSGIPGARSRTTSIAPPTKYTFSKVFSSQSASSSGAKQDMSQSAFFQQTTLPLVESLLQGQSGLMFTYGVTNSGKSHTVMGNDSPGGAGILPRALDVIFNSINGVESTANIQPFGLSGVQRVDKQSAQTESNSNLGVNPFTIPGVSRRLLAETPARASKPAKLIEHDTTKVAVDRNLRYSVFASYVEIYNEKLFDLLDVSPGATLGRSESVRASNWSLANMANTAPSSISASASITLNRRPLSLKNDQENGGKYVAGLREIKINSPEEARDLLHRGQENRAVFGTMANRASSRSHGIFTIKVIRHHGGLANISDDDLNTFTTARLSIVDLAGSERVANTGLASGDRLKEAGNINKSLMCLGQCLETLRKNQIRVTGTTEGGQAQIIKRRMSIVPFRHSKLTELFQSFFLKDGKAVMIVNANPYDTGFDENSHVMKFSAIAKEVAVQRHVAPVTKTLPPLPAFKEESTSRSRPLPKSKSSIDISTSESEASADVTIIEHDEETDDENQDPFVDMLVEKHEELRQKLYAAELRCATIEADIRKEMVDEFEQKFRDMEAFYHNRMMDDAEQNAQFMNRKIDLLVSTNTRNEPELDADSEAEDQLTDLSGDVDDNNYESGHDDEAEIEGALAAASNARKLDHSMSELSGAESVFDDATEGEVSHSLAVGDDSDESMPEEDEQDPKDGSEFGSDGAEDENMSSALSDVERQDDDASYDEGDDDNEDEQNDVEPTLKRSTSQVYVDIPTQTPDSSFNSVSSSRSAAAQESDSDSDFKIVSDSEDERVAPPRKKSGRASSSKANSASKSNRSSASTAPTRRSSNKSRVSGRDSNMLVEASNLTDLSDASMVMEDTVTPKKKRKLRKKAALQQDDYVEQIGDSSLVEAVCQSTSNRSLVGSRKCKSFGSNSSIARKY
ncbi:related to Kinesin-like protein KIF23 [Ustilago sp. UG-2017a]|nr:related to Kinesin-like protein KIF23 [Ustilago sp. UG-2017a]